MATAGKTEIWNGPQLTTRWVAAHGNLPAPVCFAIFRETQRADGHQVTAYTVHDDASILTPRGFERWLVRHRLAGPERIGVALLIIREILDEHGLIRECTIERRRGAVDGPLCGAPARVEFMGPAQAVRLYVVKAGSRLVEAHPSTFIRQPHVAHETFVAEAFSGEEAALRTRFGPDAVIVARRDPTLFEDMIGLSCVAHVQTDESPIGCGIGWHGPLAYTLLAAFPRLDHGLALPPTEDQAVTASIEAEDLVRHEMRLDTNGLGVIARQRNGQELYIVRPNKGGASVAPYVPDPMSVGSPDQRRWMRYAETHEARTILDAYQDGGSEELVVLTGDADGQVWLHRIDADGVEVARGPANDTAVAARYRMGVEVTPEGRSPTGVTPEHHAGRLPLNQPAGASHAATSDPHSLLGKVAAYSDASALIATARDAASADEDRVATVVQELIRALSVLPVPRTHTAARALSRRIARREGPLADLIPAMDDIARRLREELADVMVTGAANACDMAGSALFGTAVEDAFPDASYHIEEAFRCLALRRPTAAVFHAMTIARIGLRAVCAPDLAATAHTLRWPALLTAIDADSAVPPAMTDLLREVRRLSHAPGLMPADKHTEEEAETLLNVVAELMRTATATSRP